MATESDLPMLSLGYLEGVYGDYVRDARAVSPEWREYFDKVLDGRAVRGPGAMRADGAAVSASAALQDRVDQLVRAYRVRGHMIAQLDPLGSARAVHPELDPAFYGLTDVDLDRPVSSRTVGGGDVQTLRQLVERLRNTYCRTIGVQFMHIDDLEIRHWLQNRMEGSQNYIVLSRDEQVRILTMLTRAVVFEEFVQKKYVGAKSFSLEGSESLIPLLDIAIERCAEHGIREIVFGMAHRGRLNVLVNVIGKRAYEVFREFEDADTDQLAGRGDVKYHLGYSVDHVTTTGKEVHLSLCFNPSHLEYVNTVALGRVRAKQERFGDVDRSKALALLIHGDAAFAGEGMTQETLNLSELAAYRTGGTIHVIVNNQIGFTTSPAEGRSTLYASSIAKMLQIPIFLVNGEDPEAVAQVVHLATDFRTQFKRDVVIEMYSYRRRGHNETDEPSYTQPLMYKAIELRKPVRDAYLENTLRLGDLTKEEADEIEKRCIGELNRDLSVARAEKPAAGGSKYQGVWERYVGGRGEDVPEVETAVDAARLRELGEKLAFVPEWFNLHPRLEKFIERRLAIARGKHPVDWAAAEALAFATLVTEGVPIRLSGQDTERGTFSQRHAVLHDVGNDQRYVPLANLAEGQAAVMVCNSPLSEAGVLGYEYGYSLDCPEGLTLWEAQFGDFVNAAQVIVDQFIASAEDKWQRLSGIVLLLPHGWDGQGAEHSSARLERFLAQAAEDNIQVMNLTTPGQYFHALRRQALRNWRKPLVLMAPKSFLRHPAAVSQQGDLSSGSFQKVIGDSGRTANVSRVLLCSGKIYYELLEYRTKQSREDVAIVRVEQLYPFPEAELSAALEGLADETPAIWVQEEPENMGAWRFLRHRVGERLLERFPLEGVTRPASASPASGSHSSHKREQAQLIRQAFGEV